MKHFDSLSRLSPADVGEILKLAADVKCRIRQGERPRLLGGHVMTLVFEKPSLRTRVSFEAAVAQLGGSSLFLTNAEAGLNGRESIADVARVLGTYSDWIVLRTFSHRLVEEFVQHAGCPIINGLSDQGHPCQALSDLLTMQETLGSLAGKTLVFVGDANNVARSLAMASALSGMKFILAAPSGYQFGADFIERVKQKIPAADVSQMTDPRDAVAFGRRRLYRGLGQHGAGSRTGKTQTDFLAVPGERGPDGGGPENRAGSCIACPPAAIWKSPTKFSTARAASPSRRPKIACTAPVVSCCGFWMLNQRPDRSSRIEA